MRMSMSQANPAGSINPALLANQSIGLPLNKASFTPNPTGNVHEHNHRSTPHMHDAPCDRFVSGIDKNRQSRFYFTKKPTPIRVYLNYNEKLAPAGPPSTGAVDQAALNMINSEQINPMLNGRKLSPKTLRSQLKISPHFIDDAKNFIFNKETLSLVPILPVINLAASGNNNTLTLAEMATQPLNLPPLVQQTNLHSKAGKLNPRLASIKSRKQTDTMSMTSMAKISNTFDKDNRIDDALNE